MAGGRSFTAKSAAAVGKACSAIKAGIEESTSVVGTDECCSSASWDLS